VDSKPLERLVLMGRIVAPYGVKGWLKIDPFTQHVHGLLGYDHWHVGIDGAWQIRKVDSAKVHGATVVAKLVGIEDRDMALPLQGLRVAVLRSEFPDPEPGEYYWEDLVGLTVVNEQDCVLGQVARIFETGANDVIVVQGERERLLPFIEPVVRQIDLAAKTIKVIWDVDY